MVQLGDVNAENLSGTAHVIQAEGQTILSFPMPDGNLGVRNGVADITVSDGRLTLDASGGTNTKIHLVTIEPVTGTRTPAVLGALPADGDVDVVLNPTISANFLNFPNAGTGGATSLDNSTITNATVQLFAITGPAAANGAQVTATVNGTGGGDAINLTPDANLAANSWYRLVIEGVTDLSGEPLLPYSAVFQTGTTVDGGGGDSTGGPPPNPGNQDLDQVAFTDGGAVASGDR
ncbi:MAG: Ig-like domain-containing protein, partial [Bacteroidota bacterium]